MVALAVTDSASASVNMANSDFFMKIYFLVNMLVVLYVSHAEI